jgi:hypothetical protein
MADEGAIQDGHYPASVEEAAAPITLQEGKTITTEDSQSHFKGGMQNHNLTKGIFFYNMRIILPQDAPDGHISFVCDHHKQTYFT